MEQAKRNMINQMASKFDFKVTYDRRTPTIVKSPAAIRDIVAEESDIIDKQPEEVGSKSTKKSQFSRSLVRKNTEGYD